MSTVHTTDLDATAGLRPRGSLSSSLWEGALDVYEAIVEHPFLTELAAGTLSHKAFRHYLVQDGLYLREYATCLRTLAATAPDPGVAAMFGQHALGAVQAEGQVQAGLLAQLGGAQPDVEASPSNRAYTSYLLATVRSGSFAQGLAAVLPCYWVYWQVGTMLATASSPDPVYAEWIATYGGAGFGEITLEVLDVVDRLAGRVTDAEVARMHDHYRTGTRYEWMFWDAAHRCERWPV